MNKKTTRYLITAALIAAAYAALTYAAAAVNLAYGAVQFRFSEAMCMLAAFTPAAIPGLTLGCFLGNLTSTLGWFDWVFGSLATLLAAVCTYLTRKVTVKGFPVLGPLFATVFNAVIVGAELTLIFGGSSEEATISVFLFNALTVGAGELVVCYGLGIPLYAAIDHAKPVKRFLNGTL